MVHGIFALLLGTRLFKDTVIVDPNADRPVLLERMFNSIAPTHLLLSCLSQPYERYAFACS